MLRRIRALLRSPYPLDSTRLSLLLHGLGSGLFVTLFFFVFGPFGFPLLPQAPRLALYAGYGAVTALAIVANGLLLPLLLPRLFREEGWTLLRQVLWMGWVTLTIGLGAYALSGFVCAHFAMPADWVRLRTIVVDTFIVAVFPIVVISLANSARLLRRNLQVVGEANQRLEGSRPPRAAKPGAPPRVELVAENGKDVLRLDLDDLLFIQAEENYVRVHARGEKPQPLLRSSLAAVERQLRPFQPRLFRCHRAFIVNLERIAKVEGNAQGLSLTLQDFPTVVPVARRYVGEFRRLIREL